MASKHWIGITAVLLLGAVLRFHALGADVRFHPDEALFVTFARQAAVQGDWLLHGSLDKPPLTIYVNALALTAFGVTVLPDGVLTLDVHTGEFAARVPGVFASLLLMAVTYTLAKRLYLANSKRASWTGLMAALLVALSPLAVAFSATAFTDGLLLLCLALALLMASGRRWLWAGLWLALGFWCKQQALLYLPLVVAVGWLCERRFGKRVTAAKLVRFGGMLAAGVVLLLVWDGARGQTTSLWMLATINNDPGRLARLDELVPRLGEWWQSGQYLAGGGVITAGLGLVALTGLYRRMRLARDRGGGWMDVALAAYIVVYGLVHWLVAINVYDRYLLLVLPPFILLAARGIDHLAAGEHAFQMYAVVTVFLLVVGVPMAWAASHDQLPIGGDQGRHDGIQQVADYLNRQRLGAIVYDHWLGWELGYYMGTWSDKRRVYYPTPEAFAADALLQADRAPRYFVVPDWADAHVWLDALRQARFTVAMTYDQASFVVYELARP